MMADKYNNSNNDAEDTENRTDSCCSSTNLDIKQENTSCCASNKDLVNSLNSIPIFIQTETSCCSSNTSKETDKELEKINCCSTALPSEKSKKPLIAVALIQQLKKMKH